MTLDQAAIADRLVYMIRSRIGASSVGFAQAPTRLLGGYSAATYAFELTDGPAELRGPLVLRLLRPGDDARREIILHRAAARLGFPAPEIRMTADDSDAFDQPFLITDRADGTDALRAWGVRRAFRQAPLVLAELMARLHALPTDAVVDELESAGWSAARLGVDGVLREVDAAARHAEDAALEQQVDELRAEQPNRPGRSIVHGDLHALNLLVADGATKAVIDWELARVTHPEFDVARTKVILDCVPGMSSALLRPFVQWFGRRAGAQFVRSYSSLSPLDARLLRWWEAVHCLRLVAILRERRVTGVSSASEGVVAVWDPLEGRLAARLAELMGTQRTRS